MIELIFWGVRGTNPVFGEEYKLVGGQTSCVTLKIPNEPLIVFDAGSGMYDLGKHLIHEPSQVVNLFISHPHLDHLMGLPFFAPLWAGHCHMNIYSPDESIETTIKDVLLGPPLFPVTLDQQGPKVYFHKLPSHKPFPLARAHITHYLLNHPGDSYGYRLDVDYKSVCYITDVEHDPDRIDEHLVDFVKGCDILIYDAAYTEEEFALKRGWGHSTNIRAAEIAKAAGVGQLALFHQDPSHDDALSAIHEQQAQKIFPNSFAAHQGMKLVL